MRYIIAIALLGFFSVKPVSAAQNSVIEVPSGVSDSATFVKEKAGENAKEMLAYVANGPDGACVVIGNISLVCATAGSRFVVSGSPETGKDKVTFESGGFELYVGSTEMSFDFGGSTFTVREAVATVAKIDDKWVVALGSFYKGGQAEIKTEVSVPPQVIAAEGTSVSTSERQVAVQISKMMTGQLLSLTPANSPQVASYNEGVQIRKVTSRLEDAKKSGAMLTPIDVEHPTDLEAAVIAKDEMFEDIEIEDIEVEAGCVEVCLD